MPNAFSILGRKVSCFGAKFWISLSKGTLRPIAESALNRLADRVLDLALRAQLDLR
jgi:hypothetical protein